MRRAAIVQRALRTPTVQFFARFFIGIIPGLRPVEHPGRDFKPPICLRSIKRAAEQLNRMSASRHLRRSALLDLALRDQTPSALLLSGASRASHDQNRRETHITRDDKPRERIQTQSKSAPAASNRSVRERPVERRHRRARMAGAAGASAGSAHAQLILAHAARTAMPPAKEVGHDL